MTGPGSFGPGDLSDVAISDALLDQLGAAHTSAPANGAGAEPVLTLLSGWRSELDARAAAVLSSELPLLPSRSRRWVRAHQRTAAATAIVVALAGSTGVAAAASGTSGPLGGLHKFLYGSSEPPVDRLALRADDKLDAATVGIRAAQAAGTITTATRNRLAALLDAATALLARDAHPTPLLDRRLNNLRGDLAAIRVSDPTQPAVPDNHGGSGQGADDTGTDHHGGHTGTDGGARSGSDGGTSGGHHDAGSSGSDDGTTSGGGKGDSTGTGTGDSTGSGDGGTSGGDGGASNTSDGGSTDNTSLNNTSDGGGSGEATSSGDQSSTGGGDGSTGGGDTSSGTSDS